MAKLNDAWVLKYSIFRQELMRLGLLDKEEFANAPIVEISYPVGKLGPRYSKFDFIYPQVVESDKKIISIPVFEDCVVKILNRQEKLRLFNYYKLGVYYYGKKEN